MYIAHFPDLQDLLELFLEFCDFVEPLLFNATRFAPSVSGPPTFCLDLKLTGGQAGKRANKERAKGGRA